MFHLPYTDPMLILRDFAVANAKEDIKHLDDALTMHQDMQDNLSSNLVAMPVLLDFIEEAQTSEEMFRGCSPFHQCLWEAKLQVRGNLNRSEEYKVYDFIRTLHLVLSGTPMDTSGDTQMDDIIDTAYIPFMVSYIRQVILGNN